MRAESERVAARVRELLDGPVAHRAEGDAAGPSRRSGPALARLRARFPVRLDPGRRAAVAVGCAVLIAAVVTGAWLLAARPRPVDVSGGTTSIPGAVAPRGTESATSAAASRPGGPVQPGSAPAPSTGAADVVVDVAGKVVRPGLYHLAQGARIADALDAAGGPRHGVDLTNVNLAARVSDGQQIVIGLPVSAVPGGGGGATATGAPPPSGGSSGAGGGVAAAPVDLNTATLEQLETLPGIGPALGQRILDYRTANGPFTSIDQLDDVSGIGDVKFAALRGLVTV